MIWTRRLLGCLVLLPALAATTFAQLPPPPLPPPSSGEPDPAGKWPVLVLPTDTSLTKRLEAARDYLRVEDYPQALRQVQWVLDTPEDVLLRSKDEKGQGLAWQSVRRQAEQILDELSPRGRDVYRVQYEPPARAMLDKARQQTDPQLLAEIVRRYRHTASGETALGLLAGYYLDRGLHTEAARLYAELLRLAPADKQTVGTLLRATAAFRGTGATVLADQAWRALQARATGGKVRLGRREVGLAELERGLGKPVAAVARAEPRLFRGDERRNGSFALRPPLLEPFAQVDAWEEPLGRTLLSRARKASPKALPGRHMVAAGNKVLFRSALGIVALDGTTGKKLWTAPLEFSLEGLLRDPGRKQQILRWLGAYKDTLQGLLYENTLTGTLATDGRHVYAVDDLAVPVPPYMLWEMANGQRHLFGSLKDWLACNRLRAFDLETGKPAWQLGGPRATTPAEFTGVLFLGPPLPLEGLLWVLVEKQQKLVLYALDPASGAVRWSQSLGAAGDKIPMNLLRRCSAVHLAAADGLLLVPTHHGAVVAVDPVGRHLAWARTYADKEAINWEGPSPELPETRDQWNSSFKGGAPLIASGHVVLSGPDMKAIRCLHLGSGKLAWEVEGTGEEEYVAAVHGETILIVGRDLCRAVGLKDGRPLWQHPLESPPSGLGALAEGVYWVPVSGGGLVGLDLAAGKNHVRVGSAGSPVLGNLLIHQGALWSQDVLQVTAYPDAAKRVLALDDLLLREPGNLDARLDRAQMRLGLGTVPEAIQDVRRVLATAGLAEPQRSRAREVLYQAQTQLLRRDPAAAAPFLPEYLALVESAVAPDLAGEARVEAERERARRRVQAGGLVARSYAAAGRHREAAELLLRLLRDGSGELIATADEPAVEARVDVHAERILREILARAKPAAQAEIRAALARAATAATGPGGVEGLWHLARLADLLAGPQRVALVERLAGYGLPASRLLLVLDALEGRLSEPAEVADVLLLRAEALARAGLTSDAADCYRRLGRDFAAVVVREGQTGAQVLAAAREDKRLLTVFEAPPEWPGTRFVVKEERAAGTLPPDALYRLTDTVGLSDLQPVPPEQPAIRPTRPAGSPARTLRLAFDRRERKILVQDPAGATLWSVPTTPSPLDRYVRGLPIGDNGEREMRGGYVIVGPVALVHVDATLYGIDLVERRLRWSRRLLDTPAPSAAAQGLTLALTYEGYLNVHGPDGMVSGRVGVGGPAAPDHVFVYQRGGVAALDPATGAVLWQRGDLPVVSLAGDAETLLLFERSRNDGSLKGVRALHATDGHSARLAVGVADLLQSPTPTRLLGRDVVLWGEPTPDGAPLRRLDPLTGKDRWSVRFPPNASLIDSVRPNLVGIEQAPGRVRPFDLDTGREVGPVLTLPPEPNKGNDTERLLLADDRHWYVLVPSAEAGLGQLGNLLEEPFDHSPPYTPSVRANGTLNAFDWATGKLVWRARLPGQVLLTDPFAEVPFVLAVSHVVRAGNPPQPTVLVRVLDKATGKVVFSHDEELPLSLQFPQRVPYATPFHTLTHDAQAGWLELAGSAVKLRLTRE